MVARVVPLLALAAVVLGVAACGGSSGPGIASLGKGESSSTASAGEGAGEDSGGGASNGGSSSGGGEAGGAIGGGNEEQMVKYAQCMRSHGVPDFPEPVEGHIQVHVSPGSDLNPQSPQFQHAQQACRSLAPKVTASPAEKAAMQERALKFSQCMRSHGVPKFPDPTFSGGGSQLSISPSSGIDPRSPQFQKAQRECQSIMPGPARKSAR